MFRQLLYVPFVEEDVTQHGLEDLQRLRGDVSGVARQQHPQLQQADC